MSVCGLCPRMSSNQLFVSVLLSGVSANSLIVRPLCLNMVITFVLHLLSHYNSITKPHARFLLSLFEHLTIDFPFHFIFSIIDVHLDSVSYDKLIFPSAIARILHHFSVPFPTSNPFTFMCAIDYATINCSEAQFRS